MEVSTETYAAGMTVDLTSQEPVYISEIGLHARSMGAGGWGEEEGGSK